MRKSSIENRAAKESGKAALICLSEVAPRFRRFLAKSVLCCFITVPAMVLGQTSFTPQAGEYPIAGSLPGDQVFPDVSVKGNVGYIVWQDYYSDSSGLGISARKLDSNLSGSFAPFPVAQNGAGDQENARVTMLNNGGAAFVWQGGAQSFQNIYIRFLSPTNTWITGDIRVNTFTNSGRLLPAVATLANGNVVVVWASINQAATNSMQDIYGQLLSPTGQKIGGEFLVNQFTTYNQRTAAVAPLAGGGFVVTWVSEQQRSGNVDAPSAGVLIQYSSITNRPSVDIYARLFAAGGAPAGNEFLVNTGPDVCSSPRVAPSSDGGFMVVWGQKNLTIQDNSWDVFSRVFTSSGSGQTVRIVNSHLYGEQFHPQISALGNDYFVIWTSLAQDGSYEGVYGQFLRADGTASGTEIRVNTTTVSKQMHPALASDGTSRFLAVWTSFIGGASSFDLFAQRYAQVNQPLPTLAAPFVTALSSNSLAISWQPLSGFNVANYEVYADGAATATASVTNTWWTMTGLSPGSTHSFQVGYLLEDGRHSAHSDPASGTTYSAGASWGGIPQEWMLRYFGGDMFAWPSPNADSDGDGARNIDEFLAGTDPLNPNSVLRIRLQPSTQGLFLNWNTQPGLIYQVQTSTDLANWFNVGDPRFAAGNVDSMFVGGSNAKYYRVLRVR